MKHFQTILGASPTKKFSNITPKCNKFGKQKQHYFFIIRQYPKSLYPFCIFKLSSKFAVENTAFNSMDGYWRNNRSTAVTTKFKFPLSKNQILELVQTHFYKTSSHTTFVNLIQLSKTHWPLVKLQDQASGREISCLCGQLLKFYVPYFPFYAAFKFFITYSTYISP